ncbi:MAG: response regulator [Candidatus Aminicenantes bacterium]|nr:response regulator [Candidatus Aminicenantes bacterium]
MWLGIHGGLSRFDRETGHFISYTGKDGLPQVIYGILEDDHDSLWLSSNKGIYKFSPEDGTLKSYDVSDGLQDYHFNRGAFFKSKNGRMFFGGANGFNAFYPDDIEDNPYIPPVVITNFKVLNRDHKLEKSILQTRQLTLSYSDSFSFEFAALCFSEPGKNRYAYKLEGTHGDWIELGNKREITFNNLAPRGYTLKVKGCNDDGVWNEAGKSIIITIMPPFWQTWWFRLLGVIFMSVIIYSFYRFRVRNIEIQKTTLEAQVKERTEELERANRFKSDFLARMSHEIRTPLNAIIGFNDMMLDTDLSTEQLDYIQTAVRSGEVLLTLINDILDLSKVESGQLELEAIDFDPETTAFDVCELIRPKVGSSPVEILCRIGDKVPAYVKGDPGRFRQVLLNLMSNAAKFTRAGEIELTLDVLDERKTAMTLHTTVRDSGIGIPKEKTADIFEYFQQVSGSTAREYGGSGLGLTISKQLAKLMGGDIQVESEFGRGSAFHFFAVMEKAGRKVKKLVQPVSLQGKRVLIVDDNKHNLEILSHQLKIEGMNVVMLDRGTDVLAALKAANREGNPFDTCILDIDMPGINGFETARIIRSSKSPSPHLPLLALTSISGQSSEMREAGFDLFSPKPVRRGKLVEMLQQLLGERKLEEKVPAKEAAAVEHSTVDEDRPHIRILLVEDDPINQKMAKYLLTRAGYQVEVANNGREALSTYCSDPAKFNLILMDVQMPEMDGLEAAGTMRKQGFVHVPIIAMTAQAMKGDREKCLQAGMNDYIAKPIKRDVIFAMVKKWTS